METYVKIVYSGRLEIEVLPWFGCFEVVAVKAEPGVGCTVRNT